MIFELLKIGVRRLYGRGKIDGVLDLGDIGVALGGAIAIAFLIGCFGFGIELFLLVSMLSEGPFSPRGFLMGFSLGMILGSVIGAGRIAVDLAHRNANGTTVTAYSDPDMDVLESDYGPQFGVKVEVFDHSANQSRMGILVPDKERASVVLALKRVAIAIRQNGQNFSKRQAGRYLGEHLRETREEMTRIGLLAKSGRSANASYDFTSAGEGFLDLCLTDPFPPDPLTIRIE